MTKKIGPIQLSFFPGGYNGLDIYVGDFWSVEIKIRGTAASAAFFVPAPATAKDIVLKRAKDVLKILKEVTKHV